MPLALNNGLDIGQHLFPHLGDEGLNQVFLALEIEIDGAFGHAGGGGDLFHGHRLHPAALHQPPGRGQDFPGAELGDDLFLGGLGRRVHINDYLSH